MAMGYSRNTCISKSNPMPINLRILISSQLKKNVILSKQVKLERMTFFMNLSIHSELQLFAEELHRYLILQKNLLEN